MGIARLAGEVTLRGKSAAEVVTINDLKGQTIRTLAGAPTCRGVSKWKACGILGWAESTGGDIGEWRLFCALASGGLTAMRKMSVKSRKFRLPESLFGRYCLVWPFIAHLRARLIPSLKHSLQNRGSMPFLRLVKEISTALAIRSFKLFDHI